MVPPLFGSVELVSAQPARDLVVCHGRKRVVVPPRRVLVPSLVALVFSLLFSSNAIFENLRSLTIAKDIRDVFLEPHETNDEVLAPKGGL